MAALKTAFVCQSCGAESAKWQGKCHACDAWNSFLQEQSSPIAVYGKSSPGKTKPVSLLEIVHPPAKIPTLPEMDRVLGGGLTQGSFLLIGGAPGIGKSTLLLQLAGAVAENSQTKVLYVTGEESENQTKLRAERLSIKAASLFLVHEINLEIILSHLETLQPAVVIIDSIQTVYKSDISSAPGSVSQVRECAGELLRWCKNLGIVVILIGHITKEGSIAGPRVLEHIVDTVLYMEGESHQPHRLLRAFKNRFGSTEEVGLLEITDHGLFPLENPSRLFLQSRIEAPGSVVVPVLEGQRPLLLEMQALVCRSWGGFPKRTATGIDFNRLAILLAVLEKRCGLSLGLSDVYLNVAGAFQIREPAADLAIALSVASSAKDLSIPMDCVVLGEIGLGGEIRAVPRCEERVREAAQLGFQRAIVPKTNGGKMQKIGNCSAVGVETLQEAIVHLFESERREPR